MNQLATLTAAAVVVSAFGFGGEARADAEFATTAPTIDGVKAAGEWDFATTEFDTGARDGTGGSSWNLSGAKGTFAYDGTN